MRSYAIALILLSAISAVQPGVSTSGPDSRETVTIGGPTEGCRCCLDVDPRGILTVCRQCDSPCTCDFDPYGLPRCTSSASNFHWNIEQEV